MGGGDGVRGRQALVPFVISTGLLVGTSSPSFAGPKAEKNESGIGAGASTPGGSAPTQSSGRRSSLKCTYGEIDVASTKMYDTDGTEIAVPEGARAYSRICTDSTGKEVSHRIVVVPPRSPVQLAREALSYEPLPKPQPLTSPPNAKTYVNLKTWLAVSGWESVETSAGVPGLTTTVVAEPKEAIWKMGDGQTVRCTGPGKAYDPGVPEAAQDTDCGHIYRRSSAGVSPGDDYPATVTVTYRVTWSATDGSRGDLGMLPVTTNFAMRVREVQLVNVYPRNP